MNPKAKQLLSKTCYALDNGSKSGKPYAFFKKNAWETSPPLVKTLYPFLLTFYLIEEFLCI